MINFQRISEITREYWENDSNIQSLIKYLKSDKFTSAWHAFMTSMEVDDIIEWMKAHNVDVEQLVGHLTDDIVGIHQSSHRKLFQQYSLSTFEDEIRSEIDVEELNALVDELLNDGNDFAHLFLILKVSRPSIEHYFGRSDMKEVVDDLRNLGVNIEYFKDIVYQFLRWNQ